jgi:DNA-binding beta-propeller fold protein YncE
MVGQNNFVADNTPHNVTLDASGEHLYTANINDSTVSAFSVNAGVLTPLAGSPFATGGYRIRFSFIRTGKWLSRLIRPRTR